MLAGYVLEVPDLLKGHGGLAALHHGEVLLQGLLQVGAVDLVLGGQEGLLLVRAELLPVLARWRC
jgi:hypothetical protein